MNREPEVSVLMPLAPHALFLEQALVSIRDQTMTEWDLVAVLDGACPHNERLLRRTIPASRLTLVERDTPVGIATALREGLKHCRADLVARMDADDVCRPDRLQRQRDFLMDHPEVVALGSAAHIIDIRGRRRYLRSVRPDIDLRRRLLMRNQLIHPSVMFRRQAVDRVGGYHTRLSGAEDFELWLRLSTAGILMNLRDPLLEYRIWPDQYSRKVAFGPLMSDILMARRAAADHIGVPAALALAAHTGWRLGQSRAAHFILRNLRFMRRTLRFPVEAAPKRMRAAREEPSLIDPVPTGPANEEAGERS
jgi:hypothetical protein